MILDERLFIDEDDIINAVRGKMFEFPNGDYMYIDYHKGNLVAGHATNAGMISEIEIEYDENKSIDRNLQDLYDAIVEQYPELEDIKESIDSETKAIRNEMRKVGVPSKKSVKETKKFLTLLKQKRQDDIKESKQSFTKEDQLKQLETAIDAVKSHIESIESAIANGEYEGKEEKAKELLNGFKDTLKLGNEKIAELKSIKEDYVSIDVDPKEEIKSSLLAMETNEEFKIPIRTGVRNGFDMFHIKRLSDDRWSVWYSNNQNNIADLNEYVKIDFATDLVFDITGGPAPEYNEEDAKEWENIFDISNPQDVANELGKPVKLHGTVFYPKTNESLKEDVTEPAQETTSTESQKESGLTAIVNSLINDENEAIDGYNSAIVNFEVEGRGDLTEVFRSILAEEQVHIGELQTVLDKINPETVSNIEDGQQEAQETLDNDINTDKETV